MKPDIRQNAGRCDICGKIINMEDGDRLETWEADVVGELPDDISQADVAESVANAIERGRDDPESLELARVIRNDHGYIAHAKCVEGTGFEELFRMTEKLIDR